MEYWSNGDKVCITPLLHCSNTPIFREQGINQHYPHIFE
jgi:hypothetical protein